MVSCDFGQALRWISVSCRAPGRLLLVARASRPFAPNQKLTGGTPVPLALQETEMRPKRFWDQPSACIPTGSNSF